MYMYVYLGAAKVDTGRLSPNPNPFNCSGSDFEALLAGELGTQEDEGGEEEQD